MLPDPLHVALVQYDCSHEKEESISRLLKLIVEAAHGADLLLLAELVFTPYTTIRDFQKVAEEIPGEFSNTLSRIAREEKVYICSGIVEKDSDHLYNTAILIDSYGEVVGKYRKSDLAEGDIRGGFCAGSGPKIFTTDLGKIAVLICWDTQNLEIISQVAREKPDLVLVPCYGLAKMDHAQQEFIDCMVDECIDEWRLRMQTLAKICNAYVLRADHCGMEDRQVRVGHSIAVSPGGYVISEAAMRPAILRATLTRSDPLQNKCNFITS